MLETREFMSGLMSLQENVFYKIAKCFGLFIIIIEIMAKCFANLFSEVFQILKKLAVLKRWNAS
jgi:hypothetical protein